MFFKLISSLLISLNSTFNDDVNNFLCFQTLKSICWGGPNIVPRPEWIKTGVEFHPPEVTNAYGLKAIKGATKSFQLILGNVSLMYIMTRLSCFYEFLSVAVNFTLALTLCFRGVHFKTSSL